MKRSYFMTRKRTRIKESFLCPGYRWALNSLGLNKNVAARRLPDGAKFAFPPSFEIISHNHEDMWNVKFGDKDIYQYKKETILEYYYPDDL